MYKSAPNTKKPKNSSHKKDWDFFHKQQLAKYLTKGKKNKSLQIHLIASGFNASSDLFAAANVRNRVFQSKNCSSISHFRTHCLRRAGTAQVSPQLFQLSTGSWSLLPTSWGDTLGWERDASPVAPSCWNMKMRVSSIFTQKSKSRWNCSV